MLLHGNGWRHCRTLRVSLDRGFNEVTIVAGKKLGYYDILGPLGSGGMGQVWHARDTKLGRDVALKVLHDLFAQDTDRLARFRREAQVLASLNHPHIAIVYG